MDDFTKPGSNRADIFKKKSTTIDKRVLRANRRSQEWKQLRQTHANKNRNIEMSPLKEEMSVLEDKKSEDTRKTDSRREALMKWKREKELKDKLAREKLRKPVFKVSVSIDSKLKKLPKIDSKIPASTTATRPSGKVPVSHSTTGSTGGPATRSRLQKSSVTEQMPPAPKKAAATVVPSNKAKTTTRTRPTSKPAPIPAPVVPVSSGRVTRSRSATSQSSTTRSPRRNARSQVNHAADSSKTTNKVTASKPTASKPTASKGTTSNPTASKPSTRTRSSNKDNTTQNVNLPARTNSISSTRSGRRGKPAEPKSISDNEVFLPGKESDDQAAQNSESAPVVERNHSSDHTSEEDDAGTSAIGAASDPEMSTSDSEVATSDADLPASAVDLSASAVDLPASAVDLPASDQETVSSMDDVDTADDKTTSEVNVPTFTNKEFSTPAESEESKFSRIDFNRVSNKRGAEFSFAPNNFSFKPPDNLDRLSFQPLSPASTANFLFPGSQNYSSPAVSDGPFKVPTTSGRKRTPSNKNLRNSLLLRKLSPEEKDEVILNSPMVETKRRTPRSLSGKKVTVDPLPTFDDLVDDAPVPRMDMDAIVEAGKEMDSSTAPSTTKLASSPVRLGSIEEEDEAVSSVSPLTTTPTTTCTAEPMDMTEDSDHNIGDRNLQESAPENAVVADCIQMEDETFEPISTNDPVQDTTDDATTAATQHISPVALKELKDVSPDCQEMDEDQVMEQDLPVVPEVTEQQPMDQDDVANAQIEQDQVPQSEIEQDKVPQSEIEQDQVPQAQIEQDLTPQAQIEQDLAPQVQIEQDLEPQAQIEQDLEPQAHIEQDLAPQVQIEQDLAPQVQIEQDLAPQLQIEQDLAPQVQIEQDLAPQVSELVDDKVEELPQESKPQEVEVEQQMDIELVAQSQQELRQPDSVMVESLDQAHKVTEPLAPEVPQTDADHDVPYFRNLLVSETKRLTSLCDKWTDITSTAQDIPDDIEGQIRTTVGQGHLLMRQRFKQFSGLVDDCEFNTGERETTFTDLQGFWDMIYFQVEDVDHKFAELSKLHANNWLDDEPKVVQKKKVIKKKAVTSKSSKPAGGVKSKFSSFRAKLKQNVNSEPVEEQSSAMVSEADQVPVVTATDKPQDIAEITKTFDAGFFHISSPVSSPRFHCQAGTPNKTSAKRRIHSSPLVKAVHRQSLNRSTGASPRLHPNTPLLATSRNPSPLVCDSTPLKTLKETSADDVDTPLKPLPETPIKAEDSSSHIRLFLEVPVVAERSTTPSNLFPETLVKTNDAVPLESPVEMHEKSVAESTEQMPLQDMCVNSDELSRTIVTDNANVQEQMDVSGAADAVSDCSVSTKTVPAVHVSLLEGRSRKSSAYTPAAMLRRKSAVTAGILSPLTRRHTPITTVLTNSPIRFGDDLCSPRTDYASPVNAQNPSLFTPEETSTPSPKRQRLSSRRSVRLMSMSNSSINLVGTSAAAGADISGGEMFSKYLQPMMDKENNDIPSPLHTPRRRSISLPSESIHNLVTSMDCSLQTIDDQPMLKNSLLFTPLHKMDTPVRPIKDDEDEPSPTINLMSFSPTVQLL